jgi:hypothetical protein
MVGVHPHRSSPRSFLRFGKRSSPPATLIRLDPDNGIMSLKTDPEDSFDDVPYSADELEQE